MPRCDLCGTESRLEARYCNQCGASLSDGGVANVSPEWTTTEELLELSKALSSTLDLHLLLKKIDELVRILNVKVFESDNELLTISNVSRVREKLAS